MFSPTGGGRGSHSCHSLLLAAFYKLAHQVFEEEDGLFCELQNACSMPLVMVQEYIDQQELDRLKKQAQAADEVMTKTQEEMTKNQKEMEEFRKKQEASDLIFQRMLGLSQVNSNP